MGFRTLCFAGATLGVALAIMPAGTVSAHGYLSGPASRQAQCAAAAVSCGSVSYAPQSVEGPAGQRNCSAGRAEFGDLDDDAKPWPVHEVSGAVDFTWTLTAPRAAGSYEYFIGDKRVGFVEAGNATATRTHKVDLSGFRGRQKLLAIWNVADSANASYSCVDLDIGGEAPAPAEAPAVRKPV
ncbi:lytic polysaccharide monooxygenase auxiliary activity family 9 protein [Nocardia sp. NPDC048505]|uniref:lytic polysaccharide monooxygenase auxiliary activity family 9 protein n=1 Tax=unclassified Nocardia TaxID=2637762 RepID=UPI003405C41C